jgi:hypothetical protein
LKHGPTRTELQQSTAGLPQRRPELIILEPLNSPR